MVKNIKSHETNVIEEPGKIRDSFNYFLEYVVSFKIVEEIHEFPQQ